MIKKIPFVTKEKLVSLAGACFWYWNSLHSFLHSCGVPQHIQDKYPRESFNKYQAMRNILTDLEDRGDEEVIEQIISNFYRLQTVVDKDKLDEQQAISLLNEFRAMIGNDPIENEIKRKEREKSRDEYQKSLTNSMYRRSQLEELNNEFMSLASSNSGLTPQQRGYRLESLFFRLLKISEFDYSKPYKTTDGEQIDGHFRFEKFDYLVEIKWTQGVTKQKDLSIFDGKIRGKAQSTRGLFLSANGFDENAASKFSGDSPRIILMTGEDLVMILSDQVALFDALQAKVDAIVRYGEINYPVRNIKM